MVDLKKLELSAQAYRTATPFNHAVIDKFFESDTAEGLESEFPSYGSEKWHVYSNAIEEKKTANVWNYFPGLTYKVFSYLCSSEFTAALSKFCGVRLYPDIGLHGGGWHIHSHGGNLNPHLDYSLHPKLGLQRKINIIVYLSSGLRSEHGGQLGLWDHDPEKHLPGKLVREVEPIFNRAIIFDTTQNSWHGMSRPLVVPEGIYRKSLAIYYLCEPPAGVDKRAKALFAPRGDQEGNQEIQELIRKRSDVSQAELVYRK